MYKSIGIIGAAGSGKSTLASLLVQRGYERHALADPLKVQLGFMAHIDLQIKPPIRAFGIEPYVNSKLAVFDSVTNIMLGRMGYDGDALMRGVLSDFTDDRRELDRKVRDYFVQWVNDRKPHFRKALQYFGTETIRDLSVAMGQVQVPWVRILVQEATRDMTRGVPTVIDDCRFPDEVEALRNIDFMIVRMIRPGQKAGAPAHASEEHWRTLSADVEVINDGARDELALVADALIEQEEEAA